MKQINIKPELNIKSYEDIIAKIEEYQKRYQELSDVCEGIKVSFLKSLLNCGESMKRTRKLDLKKNLKDLQEDIAYLDGIIRELTTFNANLLIPFIMEYLSQNTFERYLKIDAQRSVSCGRSYITEYYYYICNVKDVLNLRCLGYDPDNNFDYDVRKHLSNTFICLSKAEQYALMGIYGLKGDFKNFPELENAARSIINLRLANPRLDDEELLNLALKGLRNNEATNKDTAPFNRTMLNGKRIKEMTLKEIFSSQRR